MRRAWTLAFLLAALIVLPGVAAAQPFYRVMTLGDFNASSLNNLGQLAGSLQGGAALTDPVVPGSPLTIHNLGTLPGGFAAEAAAINAQGVVTGDAVIGSPNGFQHAFRGSLPGGMQDLGTLGGPSSIGRGINAFSEVVGVSDLNGPAGYHAFAASAQGPMLDLGTLGGDRSDAYGVNDSGLVTGWAETADSKHAFLYTPGGGMRDLGSLAGPDFASFGRAINAGGQVTGYTDVSMGGSHAFITDASGTMHDIGVNDGYVNSIGESINAAGQVVGMESNPFTGQETAFIYSDGHGEVPIQDLLFFTDRGWHIDEALAVNDAGNIVALATAPSGQSFRVLLYVSNVPEPASSQLLLAGLLGLTILARKNRRAPGSGLQRHTLKERSCLTTSCSESATMPRAKPSSSRHSNRSA
jgi:probable HAF family extracellular repeat protein